MNTQREDNIQRLKQIIAEFQETLKTLRNGTWPMSSDEIKCCEDIIQGLIETLNRWEQE